MKRGRTRDQHYPQSHASPTDTKCMRRSVTADVKNGAVAVYIAKSITPHKLLGLLIVDRYNLLQKSPGTQTGISCCVWDISATGSRNCLSC